MAIAQDMRKFQAMKQDDARALFFRMARLLNRLRKIELEVDRKIIEVKAKADRDKSEIQTEYDALFAELTEYLKAHPERFVSPRKVNLKGVGSFGWESDPAKVGDIKEDAKKELLKAYSDLHGLALYAEEIAPDKKAIAAAILDGHQIPGVDHYTPPGDNPKISFAKTIDEDRIQGD